MPACQLIVCEKTSHWAAALRGALGNRPPRVVETRSLPGCEEALAQSPASVIAVETSRANIEAVLGFLAQIRERFAHAIPVAFLAIEADGAELVLREAGAVDAIVSVLEAPRIARLARRQFAQTADEQPQLEHFVADLMPWTAPATPSS